MIILLQIKLGHLSTAPSLLMIGEVDEFVPGSVDKDLLAQRMQAAAGPQSEAVVVPKGNHKLEGQEEAAVQFVMAFLGKLSSRV